MLELEKGWLSGPLDEDRALCNGRLNRRFAVVKGGKVRCIDNYSESQVNDAVTMRSKTTVDGHDTLAAMCVTTIKAYREQGKTHALKARSFDLKSAYRPLPIAESSLKWARICVLNPTSGKPEIFQQLSMPFAVKGSVLAFIRCARALQWLAFQIFIINSCYCDD